MSLRILIGVLASFAAASPAAAKMPVRAEDRALHEQLLVLDSHLDTPAHFARPGWNVDDRHDVASDLSQVDYPRMVEGGLDGGFFVIYTPQGPLTPDGYQKARDHALIRALQIRETVAGHKDRFILATEAADAARIAASGKRSVYMSIENSYPLGEDLSLLRTFHALGVRMVGPIHYSNNQFGDSSTDQAGKKWGGLSPLGQALVREANRLGMLLDASHASDDVLDQMIALSKTPIILSHTGSKTSFNHPRNIDDARLRKLAASGGVIQVIMASDFLVDTPISAERQAALDAVDREIGPIDTLTHEAAVRRARALKEVDRKYPIPLATFEDFMRQLLHILKVAGVDHVGLGLDFDGGGGTVGFDDVTDLPAITARLLKAGYSKADLEKVASGNMLRVLKRAADHALEDGRSEAQ